MRPLGQKLSLSQIRGANVIPGQMVKAGFRISRYCVGPHSIELIHYDLTHGAGGLVELVDDSKLPVNLITWYGTEDHPLLTLDFTRRYRYRIGIVKRTGWNKRIADLYTNANNI